MTEQEWLEEGNPTNLLKWVRTRLSERKLRLIASACCRTLLDTSLPQRIHEVIDVAERYAEGFARGEERKGASRWVEKCHADAIELMLEAGRGWEETLHIHAVITWLATVALTPPGEGLNTIHLDGWFFKRQNLPVVSWTKLVRDICGNSFHPIIIDSFWLNADVRSLAEATYDNRILPRGELDPARLAVLSDALEEAGCTQTNILDHLRSCGPHVLGCEALDLILRKE